MPPSQLEAAGYRYRCVVQNWRAWPLLTATAATIGRASVNTRVTPDTPHNNGTGRTSFTGWGTTRESGEDALRLIVAVGALNPFIGLAHRAKLLKLGVTLGAIILVDGHPYLSANYFILSRIQSQPAKGRGQPIRP